MVPPVIVRPPVVRAMLFAAELLSVSTPPLVMELPPSKFIPPELDRVVVPSLTTATSLPLLPIARVPSTVNEPLEDVENVDPVVVLPSSVPLLLATSKEPLLVKVVPFPTMSAPSASCNEPSLVTDVV